MTGWKMSITIHPYLSSIQQTEYQLRYDTPYGDLGQGYLWAIMEAKNYISNLENSPHGEVMQTSGDRISLGKLISDIPHAIFHVDRGIFFNLVQLCKRPADVIQDYLAGNRKSFFHPASYLVVALLCNYLVVKMIDLHFYDEAELRTMTPLAAQAIRDYDALQWWFLEHTYIYILIAIPASSIFLHLIFRLSGKRLNIAETTIVILFTIAQGVFIQTLIYLCFGWVHDGSFRRTMEMINMSILILYASIVAYRFLSTIRFKAIRPLVSLFAGIGLAVVWIASAYFLNYLLG